MKGKVWVRVWVMIGIALLLAAVPLFGACAPEAAEEGPAKPIRIAYAYSITGMFGVIGGPVTKDFKTLVDQVNKEGGIAGHPIELYIGDTESDPAKALITMKRLIGDHEPHVLMGGGAAQDLIVAEVAAEAEVPLLTLSGSSWMPLVQETQPELVYWAFRPGPPVPEVNMLSLIFTMFAQDGNKKIALLYSDSRFGIGHLNLSKALAPGFGLEIVLEESYAPDAVAFGPLVSAVKGNPEIDAIFIMGADVATGLAVVNLRAAGVTLPIAGPPSLHIFVIQGIEKITDVFALEPPVRSNLTADIVYEQLPEGDPVKDHLTKIKGVYERAMGEELVWNRLAPISWGSWYMLEDALTRLFNDQPDILDKDMVTIRSTIRDYLETTTGLATDGGIITMSPENHEGTEWGTGVYIVEWRGGKWAYLPEYKLSPRTP